MRVLDQFFGMKSSDIEKKYNPPGVKGHGLLLSCVSNSLVGTLGGARHYHGVQFMRPPVSCLIKAAK